MSSWDIPEYKSTSGCCWTPARTGAGARSMWCPTWSSSSGPRTSSSTTLSGEHSLFIFILSLMLFLMLSLWRSKIMTPCLVTLGSCRSQKDSYRSHSSRMINDHNIGSIKGFRDRSSLGLYLIWMNVNIFPVFSFTKPTMLNEVAALEILQDHSVYYKVRFVILILTWHILNMKVKCGYQRAQDLILLLWIRVH